MPMAKKFAWLAVCTFVVQGAGCASATYSGDGQLLDRGPLAGHDRYVLNLGSIDLSKQSSHKFRVAGLPSERMTIGLEVNDKGAAAPTATPIIRIALESADKATVVEEEGPLGSWQRSRNSVDPTSFYYRRGTMRYVDVGNGASRPEHVGEKADRGWGSSFVPRQGGSYILSVEVVQGHPSASGNVRLLIKGGGVTYP